MRILMISDVYFPRVNGVSTSIQTFKNSLTEVGHHVDLIAPYYPNETDEDAVIRIPSRYLFIDPEDRMMQLREIMKLIPQLKENEYDVIHIHTPFVAHYAGIKLSKALQIPVIESYHTYFEEYLFHYIPFLPKQLMRYVARRFSRQQCKEVDHVIVPSSAMLGVLSNYGIETEMNILPTGLKLNDFKSGDRIGFCQHYGIDPERPILVHIGRVAFEKNIGFLLECVARARSKTPNLLFIIAGEGPALPNLKKRANQLALEDNVKFIGYLKRGQPLWDCFSAANAFIFASHTETQGLVLLEAMALGIPVISTEAMGTLDILAPRKGALVAQPNVNDFSNKIMMLLDEPALQCSLSEDGRQYVKQWSTERMTEKLVNLYQDLCGMEANKPQ
jgi:glycosyltransferase involved in cell wall biosynthesis